MNKCCTPITDYDISDVMKAISKIDEALDKNISEWLEEENAMQEKYYKGYISALNDVKWYLQNIDNSAASIA